MNDLEGKSEAGNEKKSVLETTEPEKKPDFWEKSVLFHCKICNFSEKCQYFGKTPPFCSKILRLKEPCFVLRDPFTSNPQSLPIVLGGICSEQDCELLNKEDSGIDNPQSVCQDCSVFCRRRYCIRCAAAREDQFPAEIRAKIRKLSADLKDL